MAENITNPRATLAYLLIPAIYFLANQEEDPLVKFHSQQAIIFAVALVAVSLVLGIIPILGWIIVPFWTLASFAAWLFLIFKAYQGEEYKIPWLTDFVLGKLAKKGK